ncbi:MAG: hypothetical protein ACRDAX_04145 [Propionibacteriaceae bacterium]
MKLYLLMKNHVAAMSKQAERGLSQSTENAVLLAGAIAIAGVVITAVTAYVKSHLPQ